MKKARKLKSSLPSLRHAKYKVIMRDIPIIGGTDAQRLAARKDWTRGIQCVAAAVGVDEEDFAARVAVAQDELLVPHAKRGEKVVKAASQGGRDKARQLHEPKRKEYQDALVKYRRINPNVSLTAARKRIGKQFGVSRRTVERHTKDLSKK